MELRKAQRQKSKLKIGMSGTSGSGKTYSGLLLAKGLVGDWSKIALIDTENGSGDLYSNLGDYNVLTLKAPFTPEKYIEAIKTCEKAGMEAIIVDSITHEWDGEGGLLEIHSNMMGNSFTNWSKLTPRHNKFIQSMLQSPCHIITTVRRKQDYAIETNSNGKQAPVKIGLKEVTRDGFEYELTINFEIESGNHFAKAGKDRTGLFSGVPDFIIGEDTGKKLKEWAESGAEPIKEELKIEEKKDYFKEFNLKFQSCGSIDGLKSIWIDIESNKSNLSSDEYKNLTDIKDKLKADFSKPEEKIEYPKPEPLPDENWSKDMENALIEGIVEKKPKGNLNVEKSTEILSKRLTEKEKAIVTDIKPEDLPYFNDEALQRFGKVASTYEIKDANGKLDVTASAKNALEEVKKRYKTDEKTLSSLEFIYLI